MSAKRKEVRLEMIIEVPDDGTRTSFSILTNDPQGLADGFYQGARLIETATRQPVVVVEAKRLQRPPRALKRKGRSK